MTIVIMKNVAYTRNATQSMNVKIAVNQMMTAMNTIAV